MNELLKQFEERIVIKGLEEGIFGSKESVQVPIRRSSKFEGSDLEAFLGRSFDYNHLLAVNYYGYFKLSNEIIRAEESVGKIFSGIKTILSPVVYFNSIRIGHIKSLAPDFLTNFFELKEYVVKLRWEGKRI